MFVPKGGNLQEELDNFSDLGWRLHHASQDQTQDNWKLIFERVKCAKHEIIEKGDGRRMCRLNDQKCLPQPKTRTPENID